MLVVAAVHSTGTVALSQLVPSKTIMKLPITLSPAPAPPRHLTPSPQAIKAGNTLYVSGQIGIVPGTKDFASEGVEGQTEQVRVQDTAKQRTAAAAYTQGQPQQAGRQAGRCTILHPIASTSSSVGLLQQALILTWCTGQLPKGFPSLQWQYWGQQDYT
jgi:hypothetical protein